MMNAPALPQRFFDRCKSLNISEITFAWSGGNDQGYLDITFNVDTQAKPLNDDQLAVVETLRGELDDWAWNAFDYSGAGDGTDYGDDYVYDLMNCRVSHSEWFMARTDGDHNQSPLEVEA